MYIVISNKSVFPESFKLAYDNYKRLTAKEFVTAAMSDEGFSEYDEGLVIDVNVLTEDLYNNLVLYEASGVNIIYYRINNQVIPRYVMDNVRRFSTRIIKKIDGPEKDIGYIITYEDGTKLYIDEDTFNSNSLTIQISDYYDVVKLFAYEVDEKEPQWVF